MKESVEAGFRKEFAGHENEPLFALAVKVAVALDNENIEDKDIAPLSREFRLIRDQMVNGTPSDDDKVAALMAKNI